MPTPTTRDIITALGGIEAVADKICVEPKIVSNWLHPTRRIGAYYWGDILVLARKQKLSWITLKLLKEAKGAYAKDKA
jgi:hypothetical protein